MSEGWIKLHRKMLDNPIVCKDGDYLAVWVYLLLNATHKNYPALFKGKKIELKAGQLLTGRKSISNTLSINETKIQRILKTFENEQQIEQQTSNQNRLITILKWEGYQNIEQQDKQPLNNERTTDEQQLNNGCTTDEHKQECKNVNNERMKECKNIRNKKFTPPSFDEVKDYCFERGNSVDPQKFIDFYSSKGWMVGRNKMKDWKAAIRTWEKGSNNTTNKKQGRLDWIDDI